MTDEIRKFERVLRFLLRGNHDGRRFSWNDAITAIQEHLTTLRLKRDQAMR